MSFPPDSNPSIRPINFALIGVAGYIAPRHLTAIQNTGNRICAVTDPHDSVGILDQFSRSIAYFRDFDRFEHHVAMLRQNHQDEAIDCVTICSPNYLHDSHIRFALRAGADAICEKPLVLNPWHAETLLDLERETGRRVYTVLQLRHHPVIKDFMSRYPRISAGSHRRKVVMTYVTARGPWYHDSWKGNDEQSGGLVTNIGIHLFDLLLWMFGPLRSLEMTEYGPNSAAGSLSLEHADVDWMLSIDERRLSGSVGRPGASISRVMEVDGEALDLSKGFADLHTEVYRETLAGRGQGIRDVLPCIQLVHEIRQKGLALSHSARGHRD